MVWIVAVLEAPAMTGGLTALVAALYSIGIPKNSVLQYETQIKNGQLPSWSPTGRPRKSHAAKDLLDQSEANSATVHGQHAVAIGV